MKIISFILFVSCVFASAESPRKQPLTKYRQLWEKSLVTVKPIEEGEKGPPPPNELDDYVLGGWTETTQGYLVSLINTKDPKDRKTIAPGMPNSMGLEVLEVERNPSDYKASKVLIKMGTNQKWIGYEDKFLTLQQPRQAPKQPAQAKRPTTQRPPLPNTNQQKKANERPTKVRRVPVPPKK